MMCADASSSDEAPAGPQVPVDFGASRLEQLSKPAAPEELASHLPDWAASIMLDDDANAEYEMVVSVRRAAERRTRVVDGRWDGLEDEGADAGAQEFTPRELAEDYNLPLETAMTQLLAIGVSRDRLAADRPVKSFCSESQLVELLSFLNTCDPIACREQLADETLAELAVRRPPLGAAQLVRLCESHGMLATLGEETRLGRADHGMLADLAEREANFFQQ